MVESDEVLQTAFDTLFRWPGYEVLASVMNETPELRVYLAGGAIRDVFLGRKDPPKDFDFFLQGSATRRALAKLESCGSMRTGPFGSPRWFPGNDKEHYCDLIPVERFYNGLWHCEDIVDALNQSDFTGNAVAIDLRSGEFYDPQNGRRDMQRRVMKMVRFDYPDEPISPNHAITRLTVLWFRILYYATALNLTIESITREWLITHRGFSKHADVFGATFFPVREGFDDVLGEAINE